MNYALALQSAMILGGMFAGLMAFIVVGGIISFKLRSKGMWYVEFNRNGLLSHELLKPSPAGELKASHGHYYLSDGVLRAKDAEGNYIADGEIDPTTERNIRMRYRLGWPLGLPSWMQEQLPHEKFNVGNPYPIPDPDIKDVGSLAMTLKELDEADNKVIKGMMDAFATVTGSLIKLPLYTAIGVGIVGIVAAASAYFAYQNYQALEAVQAALGGL